MCYATFTLFVLDQTDLIVSFRGTASEYTLISQNVEIWKMVKMNLLHQLFKSFWTVFFSFLFGRHHLKTKFWQLVSVCKSLQVLLCFLFSPALLSPEIGTTHISSQGQLIQNRGWCWWFKNHIKPPMLVTAWPSEGGCPISALGVLFSRYSWALHFVFTFSAAKTQKQHEKRWYQTTAITTKWVHKWPADESQSNGAHDGGFEVPLRQGSRRRKFGIQAVLEIEGKAFTLPSQLYKRLIFIDRLFSKLSCGSRCSRPYT